MSKETLFMSTTEVPAMKSVGEIVDLLVRKGARSVETLYDSGKPTGLSWSMMIYSQPVYFRMPAKVEPVFKFLKSQGRRSWLSGKDQQLLQERAERVAWRQLLRWVQVQMAMIDVGMIEYAQVFLPYISTPDNRTVYEVFVEQRFKAIEAPKTQ